MKKRNRLGALLLAAVMVFSLLPVAAAADEAVMAETPLGEEVAEAALAEVPATADEPSAPVELLETAGMKEQSSNGLTVSFVKYVGYEGFGDARTEVEKDDLTLVAAKIQWTAVDGATGYTVAVSSEDDTRTFTDSGNDRCVWQQDNTARTARITNLYPGKTYTVTVRALGTGDNGSMTFTTKTATNALAEIAAADPEAPAAYGALPDDNQLTYHDSELAAFIHYGPNTFNNRSWGTGAESPSDFAPTALDQEVVDGWVKQFQDAGFQRLIFVAKHHDGFCLWFSDYTDHDLDAEDSGYHYDLLEQVSKACTKYDMDMGFYISPWDAYETPGTHNPDGKYGTDAYNEHYLNTLREVLDSKANGNKYGNNGKFVEVWMDGAKGSNVQQSNDFDTWFQLIHELQPECAVFSPRADGGIRWVGNEEGRSGSNEAKTNWGDISWQKVDPKNQVVSDTLTHNICDPHESPRFPRQYGKPDGVLWSVNECDVSIESEWFWHSGNTLRTMDALATMYFETVGYGSPFLLNVPPTTTGSFASASANRLAEFGREVKNSFANDLAADKTATAGSTRASVAAGKFGAANVVDTDPDNYWTMDDAAWTTWAEQSTKTPGAEGSASVTVELGETKTFDVISVQEFIPLGQRIISGVAEYHDTDGWHEFGTFHTVGARRLIRREPVNGDAVRVTINESYAVPLIRSIGVYKVTRAMALGDGIPAGMTYVDDQAEGQIQYSSSGWTKRTGSDYISQTNTYAQGAASFTYTFTGSKVYVMGIKDTANGKFEVKIDDGAWAEVNTADTSARITKTVLWASEDLTAGEHTISVKWKSGWFDFDGLCYLPGSASVLEFEKAEYTVFPSSSVDLKVKRSGDTSGTVTFQFSDQPGTAIQGDYVQMGETYTMAPGETETVITMRTTAGAVSGGSPIGKNFYGILADPTGAILGFTTETTVTIVDPDSVPQTPKGETYTADDPFQLPPAEGKTRILEAEYMELVSNGKNDHIRLTTDDNPSGGKKIGWFEPGNSTKLYYNAPVAGTYIMTLRYQSGRSTDGKTNQNTVNWEGTKVTNSPSNNIIPGLGGNGTNWSEYSYRLVVEQPGEGLITFVADSQASPNIDWIKFRLPVLAESVSIAAPENEPTPITIYTNTDDPNYKHTVQLTATVNPANADNASLVWRSSDTSIANPAQNGLITAAGNGEATITVSAAANIAASNIPSVTVKITVKTKVTGDVVISGTPKFGETLTASVNQLSHQGAKDGLSYQWNRDGKAISGATDSTHEVVKDDIGHQITVTVTATGYYEGSRTSEAVTGALADGPEVVATLDYEDCTDGNNGKIKGLNSARAYQYKLVSDTDWKDIPGTPGVTEFGGLAPGSYHVRVKATDTYTAGPVSRTLTILRAGVTGYDINIGEFDNGRVTANVRRAAAGDKVVLTLHPDTGYQLKKDSLKVTGASGTVEVGKDNSFTMPGEAVTVTAEFEKKVYTITHNLTNINCNMAEADHQVIHGETPTIELTPETGYELPQTVTVTYKDGGAAFSDYTYRDGVITFNHGIDGDLVIAGVGVKKTYNVTYDFAQLSAADAPRTVGHADALTFAITPAEGYTLPVSIAITVNGQALTAGTDFIYGATSVTIKSGKIAGAVVITANGVTKTGEVTGVTITGTAAQGQTLRAVVAPEGASAVYQWIRVDNGEETEIDGAVSSRYVLTADDVGKTVKVKVTGTGGYGGTATSEPTGTISVASTPSRPSTGGNSGNTTTETKEDGTKVTTETKPDGTKVETTESPDGTKEVVETKKDGTVTATTETPDGTKAVVETKPDGSKTQTVEQADGTKSELVATKDGDVTITVTDESGEELVKTEIPATIPEPETKFEDVDTTPWAEEAIHKVAGLELVNGTGGNKYSPVAPMTRGSLATVLHRLSQGKTDYEVTFKDVAQGKYYTEGVAWAAKANVVKGVSEDVFAPDDIITREQLAVMLARYAKLVGLNTKADAKTLEQFADGEKTGAWAVDGVAWCVQSGILKGKGQNDLDPTANVTRAEVAVMLDRFIALLK